ncbi:uncharacterized protein LOC126674831 [Mercurialis annua]|uniref:uncharacterized protein LOC126674831 n=1 Tax=Mercurialis annua TaxID=3986 RepID=UPI00215DDA08|nr:uncharacterized protein LOC126674831 [Mercurialis annua]
MFGRVRTSSSSLDRPPSKIFKDDPLSIYESTLMKLKLGSQRDASLPSTETVEDMESDCATLTVSRTSAEQLDSSTCTNISGSSEHFVTSPGEEEAMAIDTCSPSASTQSSPSASALPKQLQSKNMPLLYLFSRYNSTRHALSSSSDSESLRVVSYYDSASNSPSSSNCQSFGSSNEHHVI